jgi:hypothetical protein
MQEEEILARFSEARGETLETPELDNKDGLFNDPDTVSLFGFFNTEDQDKVNPKYLEKLDAIKEYAKEGAKDRADMLWNIKQVRSELGEPPFGKPTIDYLYEYIKLKSQAKAINKEIEAYK